MNELDFWQNPTVLGFLGPSWPDGAFFRKSGFVSFFDLMLFNFMRKLRINWWVKSEILHYKRRNRRTNEQTNEAKLTRHFRWCECLEYLLTGIEMVYFWTHGNMRKYLKDVSLVIQRILFLESVGLGARSERPHWDLGTKLLKVFSI